MKIEASGVGRRSRKRSRNDSQIKRIEPGQSFETETESKIVLTSDQEGAIVGQFHAVYHLDMNDQTVVQIEPDPATINRSPLVQLMQSADKIAVVVIIPMVYHTHRC